MQTYTSSRSLLSASRISSRISSKIDLQIGFFFYLIFLLGLTVAMMGASLRMLASQTSVTLTAMTTVVVLMPIGFIAGVYLCRYFLYTSHIRPFLAASIIGFCLLLAAAPFISSFFLVCVVFFIIAVAQGVYEVAGNIFMVHLKKDNPAPYLNAMHFCFGIGAIISPICIGLNIQFFESISLAYIFFALLGSVAAVWVFLIPLEAIPDETEDSRQKRRGDLKKILIAIHLFFFLYIFFEVGYSISIFPYLREQDLLSAAYSGLFTSVFWGVFTLFRLIGVFLSMRYDALRLCLVYGIIGVSAMPMMLFAGEQTWLLWVGNFVMGASLSIFFPCILAYCETGFKVPSKDVSHFFVSATVGAMAGSFFLVRLLDISPNLIFIPLIAISVCIPVVIFYLTTFKTNAIDG